MQSTTCSRSATTSGKWDPTPGNPNTKVVTGHRFKRSAPFPHENGPKGSTKPCFCPQQHILRYWGRVGYSLRKGGGSRYPLPGDTTCGPLNNMTPTVPQARRYTQKAVHTQGGTHKRRLVATAGVTLFKGPQARRYTQKAVHTQGGTHKRRPVATAGVMLFKGPQARRYTQKAVHTQGGHTQSGAHTRGPVAGPLNNMTPAVVTARLVCTPLCVCPALCLRRLKLHGIKREKVPKIHGLKKPQQNHSLACKKSSRF